MCNQYAGESGARITKAFTGAVLAAIMFGGGAGAANAQISAVDLAIVFAAEDFCGMKYDQTAIAAFIEKNVAADDIGFLGTLKTMIYSYNKDQQSMSASVKTAWCAQNTRLAKTHGFVK